MACQLGDVGSAIAAVCVREHGCRERLEAVRLLGLFVVDDGLIADWLDEQSLGPSRRN
jgi:hypothetical protein